MDETTTEPLLAKIGGSKSRHETTETDENNADLSSAKDQPRRGRCFPFFCSTFEDLTWYRANTEREVKVECDDYDFVDLQLSPPEDHNNSKNEHVTEKIRTIGSHLNSRHLFTLELVENRTMNIAIFIINVTFCALLDILINDDFNTDAISFTIPILNGSASIPNAVFYSNGTPWNADQTNLVANTILVSDGLNLSDWLGNEALPSAPPFNSFAASECYGAFMIPRSVLNYHANPQLHDAWNDTTAAVWIGHSSTYSHYKWNGFEISFKNLASNWPSGINNEPFPYSIESYECTTGYNCSSIGGFRKRMVSLKMNGSAKLAAEKNIYKVIIPDYSLRVGFDYGESSGTRLVLQADPYGSITACLAGGNCEISISTVSKIASINSIFIYSIVVLCLYVLFLIWWLHKLFTRMGRFAIWPSETKWLLAYGMNILATTTAVIIATAVPKIKDIDFFTIDKVATVSIILVMFGTGIKWLVLVCFADAPRNSVATKWSFYGLKVSCFVLFFASCIIKAICSFPSLYGPNEQGTDRKIGGVSQISHPHEWDRHTKYVFCSAALVQLFFWLYFIIYYMWAVSRSHRVLSTLPYNLTRSLQLSFSFFVFGTVLWIIIDFCIIIINTIIAAGATNTYRYSTDSPDVIDSLTIFLTALNIFGSPPSLLVEIIFNFVLIVIFQFLFLPPSSHAIREEKKTHYSTEEESRADECHEKSSYHLVIERARLLLVCSGEAYHPYSEEERPPQIDATELAGGRSRVNKVTADVEPPRADFEEERASPSIDAAALVGHESIISETTTAAEAHLDKPYGVTARSQFSPRFSFLTKKNRLAGEPGEVGSYVWGCRVVHRVTEPVGANIHDTHAIIFRHVPSGDLIVAFQGTKTRPQMRTDLMMSAAEVTLNDMLTVTPWWERKRNHKARNVNLSALEAELPRLMKVDLMNLLSREDEELPNYLAFKSQRGAEPLEGNGKLHFGFWSSYNRVRREMHARIYEELIARPGRILFTGHSLGGALSILCAYDMCRWVVPAVKDEISQTLGGSSLDQIHVSCYAFGAPSVGNRAFVDAYNKVVPDTHIIIADGDIITNKIFNFRHVGRKNIIDRTGIIRVNPLVVEKLFSLQHRSSARAHMLSTYALMLSTCGKNLMSDENVMNILRTAYGLPLAEDNFTVSPT